MRADEKLFEHSDAALHAAAIMRDYGCDRRPLTADECVAIEPAVFGDERGFFFETWNAARFGERGLPTKFVQSNVSSSSRGVLRGLHYQWPNPQGKLVSVLEGEVYDVAVDIRRGSPTFGRWAAVMLSAENKRQLWVPPGFAHGFLVTSESAEFLYKTTDYWHPEHERSLLWCDQTVGVQWPIQGQPKLASKDASGKVFAEAETFD